MAEEIEWIKRSMYLEWSIRSTWLTNAVVTMTGESLLHDVSFALTSNELTIDATPFHDFVNKLPQSVVWIGQSLLSNLLTPTERLQIAASDYSGVYTDMIRKSITAEEIELAKTEVMQYISKKMCVPINKITISQNEHHNRKPYYNSISIQINDDGSKVTYDTTMEYGKCDKVAMSISHWKKLYYTKLVNGTPSIENAYSSHSNLLTMDENRLDIVISRIQAYRDNITDWLSQANDLDSSDINPEIFVKIINGQYVIKYPTRDLPQYIIGDKTSWWNDVSDIQIMIEFVDGRGSNQFA